MQLLFKAGAFEAEAWTDGHPMWLTLRHNGEEIAHGIHHNEIKDLAYVIDQMTHAMRASLGTNYKHELD